MKLTSPAFKDNETIPVKCTCDDENVNPPLLIEWLPPRTRSLVLIVDDPDAPGGVWNHWLVFNIDPSVKEIKENSLPSGAVLGTNDFGQLNYGGPCPPVGTHHYFFRLYALDCLLKLPQGIKRKKLEEAMKTHIRGEAELVGIYSR